MSSATINQDTVDQEAAQREDRARARRWNRYYKQCFAIADANPAHVFGRESRGGDIVGVNFITPRWLDALERFLAIYTQRAEQLNSLLPKQECETGYSVLRVWFAPDERQVDWERGRAERKGESRHWDCMVKLTGGRPRMSGGIDVSAYRPEDLPFIAPEETIFANAKLLARFNRELSKRLKEAMEAQPKLWKPLPTWGDWLVSEGIVEATP